MAASDDTDVDQGKPPLKFLMRSFVAMLLRMTTCKYRLGTKDLGIYILAICQIFRIFASAKFFIQHLHVTC